VRRVPKGVFEFTDRGTQDEVSLNNNRSIFDGIRFKLRTLVDVSKHTQATTIFGVNSGWPSTRHPTGRAHDARLRVQARTHQPAPAFSSFCSSVSGPWRLGQLLSACRP